MVCYFRSRRLPRLVVGEVGPYFDDNDHYVDWIFRRIYGAHHLRFCQWQRKFDADRTNRAGTGETCATHFSGKLLQYNSLLFADCLTAAELN